MPPKKGKGEDKGGKEKGKKEDEKKLKPGQFPPFTEVDKVFLELQLAECNRKNARLLQAINDFEIRNDELQAAYDKLDEDRADIIAFLKKQLNAKTDECQELKEKVRALEELRELETAQFLAQIAELEKNFKLMKDQLTSENKLLAGKLNTLEEFRAIRDDLMAKFENQELAFMEQEMKYKRLLYEAEKKYVIGKDKLKKEMEARLLQLAQDFQDATELRIAASTHRVIRENIAINNELDNILKTQAKLAEMNERSKENERDAKVAKELAEEERDKAINKNVVQLKVIDQLTNAFQEIKQERALYEKRNFDFVACQTKIQRLTKENENLALQVRILEQNIHAKFTDQNKSHVDAAKIAKQNSNLKKILREAGAAIQAALKLDNWAATDPTRELMDRQILLARLLEIVSQYRDVHRTDSMDTLASFTKIYEEGDLGFVPKPVGKKKIIVTTQQPGESLEILEKVEEEHSPTFVSSETTIGSIQTIPSLKFLPQLSKEELSVKESIQSFQTSIRSSETSESGTEEGEEEEELNDMESQLAASKLEVQKSLLKDLAASITAMRSSAKIHEDQKSKISSIKEKEKEGEEERHEVVQKVHIAEAEISPDEAKEGEEEKKEETEVKEE